MADPLEELLFYRCQDCGARAGEYLGDDHHHVFGVNHASSCPAMFGADDVVVYEIDDDPLGAA